MTSSVWTCCQCDGLGNPLSPERCPVCGHCKCIACGDTLPLQYGYNPNLGLENRHRSPSVQPMAHRERFTNCTAFEGVADHMDRMLRFHRQQWWVVFALEWNIRRFVQSQLGGSWDLKYVLVLSGDVKAAYATTCEEYIKFAWGEWGLEIFQSIVDICKNFGSTSTRAHHDLVCEVSCTQGGYPAIIAKGRGEDVCLLATLITWMVAVFQEPSGGGVRSPIMHYSKSSIMENPELSLRLDERYISNPPADRRLGYTIKHQETTPVGSQQGSCWIPLFKNCVIAQGYPIPNRMGELGVEIPLEILIKISRISYSLELPQGMILKGYSTMLIPTLGQGSETFQWHFLGSSNPGEYISADSIPQALRRSIRDLKVSTLHDRRSFVGYCSEAYVHVGTRDSGFENITLSHAECSPTTVRIGREINPTMGIGGLGTLGGGIGAKVIFTKGLFAPIEEEEACLEDRLLNSKENGCIIYNTDKKTGFMIPELNSVLLIAHTWASRQSNSKHLVNKMPFIPPTAMSGQAAFKTVMENLNLILREAYADEKELFFITKLKDIFRALERRKEQQRIAMGASTRIIERRWIRGWEICDIAACKPSNEKRVKLPLSAPDSWHKIPRENPDMIVLLCKGISDAIRPGPNTVCKAWYPLPQDHYLIASAECVKSLSEKHGGTEGKPRFAAKLYLNVPRNNSILGNCEASVDGGCNHAQSLRASPPYHEVFLNNGAIIFGKRMGRKSVSC